jgi:hypothetical protein
MRPARAREVMAGISALLLWSATSVAAASAESVDLQRTTTIGGDHTGYAELTVPRPLHVLGADKPSYRLSGGGGIAGIVLRAEESLPNSGHPDLEILRLGPTPESGGTWFAVGDGAGDNHDTLPAGAYRFYLVADRDASATLEFPTIAAGSASLAPTTATPFHAGSLPTLFSSPAGSAVFGRSDSLTSDGIVFLRAAVSQPSVGQRLELCTYDGGDHQAGSSAYTSGCPGGQSNYTETATSREDIGGFVLTLGAHRDTYGEGGNLSAPLIVSDPTGTLNTFGMWMSFDPANSPTGPTQSTNENTPPASPGGSPPPAPATSPGSDPVPALSGGGGPPTSQATRGLLASSTKHIMVHGRSAAVNVTCSLDGPCNGTATLLPGGASEPLSASAGQQTAVVITLSKEVARQVARRKALSARLRLRSETTNGLAEQRTRVTLIATAGRRPIRAQPQPRHK